jgi:BON domain
MKLSRLVLIGATGAALAYFFDPDRGDRRRSMARDRVGAFLRRSGRAAAQRSQRAGERAAGMPMEAMSNARPVEYDDATLSEKVYTYLNADPRYDGKVNVSAQNGVVVLIGEVEDPDEVVRLVRKVKGVGQIESLLHRPGTPAPHMA